MKIVYIAHPISGDVKTEVIFNEVKKKK